MHDHLTIQTAAGEVFVRRASVDLIAQLDAVIFDMDGVLIDVSDSIQLVHGEAAQRFFEAMGWTNCQAMVEPSDVDAFKLAGGFNNDWDAAAAWLLLYLLKSRQQGTTDGAVLKAVAPTLKEFAAKLAESGGYLETAVRAIKDMCGPGDWEAIEPHWDRPALERTFQETYSGDLCPEVYGFEPKTAGPGLIHRDRSLLDKSFLPPLKLGIATGRTGGETRVAVRLMGWGDAFPEQSLVTEGDGFLKPDPRVLDLAARRLGARMAMYIGDTPDDMRTVRRYNEDFGPMLSCMVRTGLKGSKGDGADVIADNVNAALAAVKQLTGGA